MGDMKDKFKGFMKKVNNQLSTSSSGKFKGQGRVLGSSSSAAAAGPTNSNIVRQSVNQPRNPVLNTANSKPVSQKLPSSGPVPNAANSSSNLKGQIDLNPNPNPNTNTIADLGSSRNPSTADGFDPYGSLITTGKRNKNGFSLNVFECPVCKCGFGSVDEVSLHIETCIGEASKDVSETEGVVAGSGSGSGSGSEDGGEVKAEATNEVEACVGVYLSGNPFGSSVDVVLRLFGNIVKDPVNQKFRKIRISNPKIREAVGDVAGGIELLEQVGFELKEEGGEMWAMMEKPSKEGVVLLKEAIRLLEQGKNDSGSSSTPAAKAVDEEKETEKVTKTEPEIIDRQIKVFFSVSESVASRIELPDSFYKLSLEEVKKEAEMRKKKMADSQLLIPKSLKEKQSQALRRRYTRTIIRVQFPDGVVLQGVFSPKEPTSALYEFVSSALKQQGLEFELVHPIPVKRRVIPCFPKAGERASTLDEEDLVPSALVKFKPFETDDMVFTGLTNVLLEMSEPLGTSTS